METAGDSEDSSVIYEKRGNVVYVTLNRPHVLNAMDGRMHERLQAAWDAFNGDADAWVAVLSGSGARAFSVGQDIKELARNIDAGTAAISTFGSRGKPGWPRLTDRFDIFKPVIAKVRGYALGGGFELALACDIILAADDAVFGLPEARLGLIPGAGGVFRLARQLPFRTALGYMMTGRRMDARRAFDLGLVNAVVPESSLDAETDAWVADILACAPLSVRALKQAALESEGLSLPQAFAARYACEEQRMHSADAVEGPRAFAEKRAPRWRGE